MENRDYTVTVINSSFEKLRGIDKLRYTNFSAMRQMDELVPEDGTKVALEIVGFVQSHIHNGQCENSEYDKMVLIGKDGELYVTGSDSFATSFIEIHDALTADFIDDDIPMNERVYPIIAFKVPSNNIKGKTFLCCGVQ